MLQKKLQHFFLALTLTSRLNYRDLLEKRCCVRFEDAISHLYFKNLIDSSSTLHRSKTLSIHLIDFLHRSSDLLGISLRVFGCFEGISITHLIVLALPFHSCSQSVIKHRFARFQDTKRIQFHQQESNYCDNSRRDLIQQVQQ